MADAALDYLLLKLKRWIHHRQSRFPYSSFLKDQITSLFEKLRSLTNFLKDSEKNCNKHEEITRIIDLGFDVIDTLENFETRLPSILPPRIHDVLKEIDSFFEGLVEVSDKKYSYGTGVAQDEGPSHGSSSSASAPILDDETVVGFDHKAETIKEELVGGPKHLEVISIYGMGGSGKTTLATKLYSDPYIVYHFYIRAWTYVSQEYQKKDLLLCILSSFMRHAEIYSKTREDQLGEKLYKQLKGKRYLIVMDDIWHVKAWNDLKTFFPNDNNGSRIILTSRHKEVALHAKPNSPIHFLSFLTEDESWDLLQQKVFLKETCPLNLVEIGIQIAKKCQGLPLAIVVVAGLLANTNKTQDWWNQVAEKVGSFLVSDPKQCLDTLALSYNHLPHHLKPCFLYFGSFPEDYEISVQKLIWLWIAEGFIHQIDERSLEDVAVEYLMDLIDRSLVLIAKRRSIGGIKSCRIHDLLRDLCLRKAEEENFLHQIYGYEQVVAFFSCPEASKQHRLSIHSRFFNYLSHESSASPVRSCLCYIHEHRPVAFTKISLICQAFKLLRVLDLSAIQIFFVPAEIEQLFDLRHLSFQIGKTPMISLNSIFKLWNLETLIVSTGRGFKLLSHCWNVPNTIWKMVKLRHVHMPGRNNIHILPTDLYASVLDNLQTLSLVSPSSSFGGVLARTPNLKKLGFFGPLVLEFDQCLRFPDLDFLCHLETLKLSYSPDRASSSSYWGMSSGKAKLLKSKSDFSNFLRLNRHCGPCVFKWVKFPPNLKKLTLENTWLDWKEMSILGMLPNLEVLKLSQDACIGPKWKTRDGEFCKLKFLKLDDLPIEQWNTSSIHFPSLQHLVQHMCQKLDEVPSNLGNIPTLQNIEIWWCSYSAVNSARQIQEEQQSMGNDWLKILINRVDEKISPRKFYR